MRNCFVSIVVGTNRPENIWEFIDNIESTSSNPENIEVLFSVDCGDFATINAIKEASSKSKISLKYLEGNRSRGYFSANIEYNRLLEIASNTNGFFANFSDKTRIQSLDWDKKLQNYQNCYADSVFRVRISSAKNRSYKTRYKSFGTCENFALHSRKWLELAGGWGNCWGPDSWAQLIEYDLGKIDKKYWRGIVADDIELEPYFVSKGSNSAVKEQMCDWAEFYVLNLESRITFKLISSRFLLYFRNYKQLRDGYGFVLDKKNNQISICNNSGELLDSMIVKLGFSDLLECYIKPSSFYIKIFSRKFNAATKIYKLFFELFGALVAPYLILKDFISLLCNIKRAKNTTLENIEVSRLDNGFEIISNKLIEQKTQEAYEQFTKPVS